VVGKRGFAGNAISALFFSVAQDCAGSAVGAARGGSGLAPVIPAEDGRGHVIGPLAAQG